MRVKLTVCVDIHRNYAVMVSMHSRCGRTLDLVDIEQYRTSLVDFDLRILSLASSLYPLISETDFW